MPYLVVLLLFLAFLVPIIYFAGRAARKGRRYMGNDDPIERYEDQVEANWAFPWGGFWGRGGANYAGWQWRVRLQARRDAARHRRRVKGDPEGLDKGSGD